MKFFIFVLISITLINRPITVTATDHDLYALCESSTVKFYSDASTDTFLFYLPESYYLKVLEKSTNFTHVECFMSNTGTAILDGYILTDSVTYTSEDIAEPYLNFSIITSTSTNIYSDTDFTSVTMHIFANRSLTYYGYAYDKTGGYIYYVSYNNRFGYVSEKDITPFTVPLHSGYKVDNNTNNPKTQIESKTTESVPIIVIVVMSFASLVILFSLLKPTKNKRTYDEY